MSEPADSQPHNSAAPPSPPITAETANAFKVEDFLISKGLEKSKKQYRTAHLWEGYIDGRKVQFSISLRQRTQYYGDSVKRREFNGIEVALILESKLQTRLTITGPVDPFSGTLDKFLTKRIGLFPFEMLDHASYAHLRLHAYEEPWAKNFLINPEVSTLLGKHFPEKVVSTSLGINPGIINFRRRVYDTRELNESFFESLFSDVFAIAALAETVESPEKVAVRGKKEIWIQENTALFFVLVMLGIMMALPIMVLIPLILFAIIVKLNLLIPVILLTFLIGIPLSIFLLIKFTQNQALKASRKKMAQKTQGQQSAPHHTHP